MRSTFARIPLASLCLVALVALFSLFTTGCATKVERVVTPVNPQAAPSKGPSEIPVFREKPAGRQYTVLAEVLFETIDFKDAKRAAIQEARRFNADAVINLRPVKVGMFRGLAVQNWQADLVIWEN